MFQDSYCASFLPSNIFLFFDNDYGESFTKDAAFSPELWKFFRDGLSQNSGNACTDEMWNLCMKLDDRLIEGITMIWKVAVDIFLFDSIILSLDDDHLRLR